MYALLLLKYVYRPVPSERAGEWMSGHKPLNQLVDESSLFHLHFVLRGKIDGHAHLAQKQRVCEMKWTRLEECHLLGWMHLVNKHSSISNEVAAQWQQQQQPPQHPSTKCHCTMFAFCNAAHSFDLQFLAFYLVAFVAASARRMFVRRARFLSTYLYA